MSAYLNALREEGSRNELLRQIEKLYAERTEAAAEIEQLRARLAEAVGLLSRAGNILTNMAQENERAIFRRWPINHEPLRADAKNVAPLIDAFLAKMEVRS